MWGPRDQLRFPAQVVVEGVTRASEPRSSFVPDNVPADKRWFWVDVPALAAAAGLPPETPLVEVPSNLPFVLLRYCPACWPIRTCILRPPPRSWQSAWACRTVVALWSRRDASMQCV